MKPNANQTVPIEPFRKIIERARLEVATENDEGLGRVSDLTGISPRRIRSILSEQDMLEFDLADRIVTKILGPFAWYEDPELREIYEGFDLRRYEFSRPCSERIKEYLAGLIREKLEEHDGSRLRASQDLGIRPHVILRFAGPKA